MVILVDERIPGAVEAFAALGEVRPFRDLPASLGDAGVLVVRSATRIDAPLLERCPRLGAIATPVIGTDHVDRAALEAYRRRTGRPIPLFNAPGSTAGGVADFALAALSHLARAEGRALADLRVGIWGFGNCGGALGMRLDRLGVRHADHDPPLAARSGGEFRSASLEELLACDAVSLHVPLTRPGDDPWPTHRMVSAGVLARGPRILVNTARGAVVDNAALARAIDSGRVAAAVDVWEGEPTPDPALVERCALATPHAAGSVIEGRLRATAMVVEAVREFLALPPRVAPPPRAPSDGAVDAGAARPP
ncbi:MAG: 4-phosphoerythronate dehydrogenase, partial [Deltaproteobacteria bacterium]|nr:4-phosphoerythronate dehydrogenase [Deltaproteobacteria bacterium]